MILHSSYKNLKAVHTKGVAVFKNGIYETKDKDIINELLKDSSITCSKDIDEISKELKKQP